MAECVKSNLESQYLTAMSNVSTYYYYNIYSNISSALESDDGASWVDWISDVADLVEDYPQVIAISYSSYESDISVKGELGSFATEAIKCAAKGITLIASSGDDGVSGWRAATANATDTLSDNLVYGLLLEDTSTTGNNTQCGFNPMFPASCPYVTAVGGTSVGSIVN